MKKELITDLYLLVQPPHMVDKQKLKSVFLRKRKTISKTEFERRNAEIFYHFSTWLERHSNIKNVHCFLPIEKQKEIDTRIFIKYLKALDFQIVLSQSSLETNDMTHYYFESKDQLEENKWGILEPTTGQVCACEEIDIVLVPLVVFDRNGHRIGYGKGYYDKFLNQCKPSCLKVGVSMALPLDKIPYVEDHDIPLDVCITPYGIYEFGS
ncbi:5-formyltetrahydrofolate cyclo-ligase [Reichenbachiella versicolor]|uniref:5-formyltetrahydrofolate cyclo-ligase n=1 Tax=Reichenbachiella versicolor TaxID=1821036 RepID=UPI0013A5B5DC|nr:5-formyltetrahydrofolate cyclo-ligase [Reichenbachiella versicolor]